MDPSSHGRRQSLFYEFYGINVQMLL